MMRRVWVTGTDTGVGKTVVGAALLCALRARGIDAVPMKPVETGCSTGALATHRTDLDFCLEAAGLHADIGDEEAMHPYRFPDPCSPHLAAERAGAHIDPARIRDALARLATRHTCVLAEGAGGVLVPITRSCTFLDVFAGHIDAAVIAARPGLGTLNHTLLTIRALRDRDIPVAGIVCSGFVEGDWIAEDNRRTLAQMSGVAVHILPPLRPRHGGGGVDPAAVRAAAGHLADLATALCGTGVSDGR